MNLLIRVCGVNWRGRRKLEFPKSINLKDSGSNCAEKFVAPEME